MPFQIARLTVAPKPAAGRARAVEEAVRVLRPGGRLLIADIPAVEEYRRRLADLGMDGVRVRPLAMTMRNWRLEPPPGVRRHPASPSKRASSSRTNSTRASIETVYGRGFGGSTFIPKACLMEQMFHRQPAASY